MIALGSRKLAPVREQLLRYARRHRIQQWRLLRRFEIMVVLQAGVEPGLAVWLFGCSVATVRRWGRPAEESAQLLDGKRSGRPRRFAETTRVKLVAFYCQYRLPGCRGWSVRWAARYLNEHLEVIGRPISSSTIHRVLTEQSQRPHRVRYFLHISDPLFFPKMEHLIQLYMDPPPYLFCLDECTGLQALERIGVEMVTSNGVKIEFEYKRHGTRDFYAIMHVNSGQVFGRDTDNHRQETLVEVFTDHVHQQPEDAVLHYICDNLAGHSTELFCRTVAQLARVPYPSLKTAPERRQWLQSDDKRIVFHFTPCHGSWLNLVEIWFGIAQRKCLKGRSFTSAEELGAAMTAFSDTWTAHFAHPFRWTYTGEGLAEKVICRFTEWLVLQHKQMKPAFLDKQLQLLTNLLRDYWTDVPPRRWQLLLEAFTDGHDYLAQIIDGSKIPQESVETLLDELAARLAGQVSCAA